MFVSRRKAGKRFTLLLLEDEESYVADWVATCRWPASVPGNWSGAPSLPGRLRLATRSLFFEPDDARVPIVRLEFAAVQQLEAESMSACSMVVSRVTRMKAGNADEPYAIERGGKPSTWVFSLTYAKLDAFMPLAQEQLVISRLPAAERLALLDAAVKAREDASSFDTSRLAEFSERVVWEGPVLALSPLTREPGRLAVTDARVYFQPLHNISGDTPVRSHPLAAVAAVARRRASLRPVGLELFMINPALAAAQLQQQQQGQQQQQQGQQQQQLEQLAALPAPFWDAPSAFFTFRSQEARDAALAAITRQPQLGVAVTCLALPPAADAGSSPGRAPPHGSAGDEDSDGDSAGQHQQQHHAAAAQQQLAAAGALLEASSTWLHRVMMAWQVGKISNFDYLLYLNLAAGRSFNDLAQWPVFPWVLRDYTSASLDLSQPGSFRDLSKPMGAQTPARLEVFRQRFHDMESLSQHVDAAGDMPAPFMYGTHYSTPGYVMYWLVRAAPAHMLRLQGGKFDAPDRLFNSLADAWHSATTSTTDVKELIPEFYMQGGDFLVNGAQLALGVRQSGRPVHDVELPPWASGPDDVLAKLRAALEAPYVSQHLHEWIDLIFGAKQTGPAAVEADNVFYHLTYEGALDTSKVTGLQELRALETQINEFGQTPKQLFLHPHPPRLVAPPAPDPATIFGGAAAAAAGGGQAAQQGRESPAPVARVGSSTSSSSGAALQGASTTKARLKGGGEDAAGGAICFALLSTILAAAGPDIDAAEAETRAAAAAAAAAAATAAAAGGSRGEGGMQLSPVGSGDLQSAATCSLSPEATKGAAGCSATDQQQQQQQQGGALRGMLSRAAAAAGSAAAAAAGSAAAAAGSAAASVASAVQGGSSGVSGRGGPAPLPALPALAGGKMVSWMQQQFAEGLTLRAGGANSSSPSNLRTASSSALSDATSSVAAAAGQPAAASGSQSAAAASAKSSSPAPATPAAGSAAAAGRQWPRSLPEGLRIKKSVRLGPDPLTAVAASPDGGHVLVAGHGGLLRVLDAAQLTTVRSMKLDSTDLLCLLLLPPGAGVAGSPGPSPRGRAVAASGSPEVGGSSGPQLPLVLAGAHNGRVVGYAATAGRMVGSWVAHQDAVSCLLQLGGGGSASAGSASTLATGSWDCCVKTWDLAEGRAPWATTTPIAASELRDLDSGVWALAGSASGHLLVTGSEEGVVGAWDLRTRHQIWASQASSDYVGGLSLLPGGNYVAAAAADGSLSLLDWRRAGQAVASAACGAPLRCCVCDGALMVAGSEAGQLCMWDLLQLTGQSGSVSGGSASLAAGPDGLYPPLSGPSKAAVNCVDVAAPAGRPASVLAALDDGSVVRFEA